MAPKFKVLRRAPDGMPIFDGADVFRFVDTHGLPLEFILQRMVFDVPSFVQAALTSGNWKPQRIRRLFHEAWRILGVEIQDTQYGRDLDSLLSSAGDGAEVELTLG